MRFESRVGKFAHHNAASCDIVENAAFDAVLATTLNIIQSGSAKVLEQTSFKTRMADARQFHRSRLTAYPSLVLEISLQRRSVYGKFVSIQQIHTGLQRHITQFGWTHPGAMHKANAFKHNMLHGSVEASGYFYQGFQIRNDHFCLLHVFALARYIIKAILVFVEKPFAGFVH